LSEAFYLFYINFFGVAMNNEIGARLRQERERLGFNQTALAAQLGIKRNAQGMYELGKTSPDANYLTAIGALGFNVPFVLLGNQITDVKVSTREIELLDKYRLCKPSVQAGIMAFLQTVSAQSEGD